MLHDELTRDDIEAERDRYGTFGGFGHDRDRSRRHEDSLDRPRPRLPVLRFPSDTRTTRR